MPGENNGENNSQQVEAPKVNVFGEQINPPQKQEGAGNGDQKKDNAGAGAGDDKNKNKIPEIPEDHPSLVKIKKDAEAQIEQIKKEYGGNLSKQGEVIKTLENKIKELVGGKKQQENNKPVFASIKRSKDLTKEEREEMTDAEIRNMDQIADMQESLNKLFEGFNSKLSGLETSKESEGGEGKIDAPAMVREEALRLAGNDRKKANEIIESFNALKFSLEGLSEEDVLKRVEMAYKNLPDYKPPKEQESKPGAVVKDTKTQQDSYGVDTAIQKATEGRKGTGGYSL